jgi:hypothetical protein
MAEKNSEESREFTRVPIKVEAEVHADGQSIFCEETRDVSMKGLFLKGDKSFPMGTKCVVTLFLGGKEGGMRIDVKGVVEHSSEKGMGVQFSEIGLDSYEHLQNLVLYNSQDSHKVEKEIHDHLGLKKREP